MSLQSCLCPQPELWGGIECTVNRVGEHYFDQLTQSGHAARLVDLDLIAGLGITALRYPILWERTAPDGLEHADWSWADERLTRLRELAIQPIVGLVHHGSGPRHTSLVDPGFAVGLAEYARAVAERYPWIERYTPVNEPLTTARFSGLYGHWYPHGQDPLTFCRALLNQCRAVVLSMQAIREINPAAQLIQTDDLGKTFSTAALIYQADFENARRWTTFDLLCGRVEPDHPMFHYMRWAGVEESEITWFLDHPCPPDVLGINYYLTGERFLDDDYARYPAETRGGNGLHAYADVEAVRVRRAGIAGPGALLREAWERYGRPLAITEAHLGCTREEQLRWLVEVSESAGRLRREGVDVRAVTAWSLLGAYDWNSLVTKADGYYEPGVFDLRGSAPRATALARMVMDLAAGRVPDHPLLGLPGWWQRPERLIFGFSREATQDQPARSPTCEWTSSPRVTPQPLLITDATTRLGQATARLCDLRGIPYRLLTRRELDITDPASIEATLAALRPWAVVNTARYVALDAAEHDPLSCYRAHVDGVVALAAACARHGVALLTFSTDLVFDGASDRPYVESDAVAPLNFFGRAQAIAETRVMEALPGALIARTSAVFGPWDERNFILETLRALRDGEPVIAANDTVISPTYLPDLIHAGLDLLIDGESGLWHLANVGAVSWADLARSAATLAGFAADRVDGRPTQTLGHGARYPRYSVLGSERGVLLPSLDEALARYMPTIGPHNHRHSSDRQTRAALRKRGVAVERTL